jgi:hydrogenase nickel incorporation protein HypA/HybF
MVGVSNFNGYSNASQHASGVVLARSLMELCDCGTSMHEMSIAQEVIEIVQQHLPPGDGLVPKSVKLRIGELAGVVPESLEFCFAALTRDTALRDASLLIERVPLIIECKSCGAQSPIEVGAFVCPSCHSFDVQILSGTDLRVVEIEFGDGAENTI